MRDDSVPVYAVTCLYGLERTLAEEVEERLGSQSERRWCQVAFPFAGPPSRLRELRVGGHVFREFAAFRIGHTVPHLDTLRAELEALPLAQWEEEFADFAGQEVSEKDISVSVSRTGEHNYSYQQIEELVVDTIGHAFGRRAVLDSRPLELRIVVQDDECHVLGRLSVESLARRPWRIRYWNGETDATLAAAMVRLARPRPGDTFLDPFCGSGTVAIERALAAPVRRVVAGDVKPKRIEWAEANRDAAGVDIELGCWDAGELPFEDLAFSTVCTVPPHSDPEGGRPWVHERFAQLVGECHRVLEFGGRSVWLLRDERPMKWTMKNGVAMRLAARVQVDWKGRPCYIHVIEKTF